VEHEFEVAPTACDEVLALLGASDLPVSDLDPWRVELLAAHGQDGSLVGCVGIERQGSQALLRSLAVDSAYRGRGVGAVLIGAALEFVDAGTTEAYAITLDAEDYLLRFGFRQVDRAEVSGEVTQSSEFTSTCPDDAVVLRIVRDR
jgi:amino-acid N-acetyltransferase